MMRKFSPFYPWQNANRNWVIRSGNFIPVKHVAEMVGMSKQNFERRCKELQIEFAQENPPPGSRRSYDAYVKFEDFPTFLRTLDGWTELDIEEGMTGLRNIVAAKRGGPRGPRGPRKSKPAQKKEDDDDDDVIDLRDSSEVLPSKKRNRSEESLSPSLPSSDVGAKIESHLKRMETRFEQSLALMSEEKALAEYKKSDVWEQKKQKALQDAVIQEMPTIREFVKNELRGRFEKEIEEEVRRKYAEKHPLPSPPSWLPDMMDK